MLLSYLNAQRNHVLGILEGLSEESLRRPVLPSGWSCLGLVHHLAADIDELAGAGDAWQFASNARAEDIFDEYRQEIDLANAIIIAAPLDSAPAWWPDFFGDWRLHDLREVILHVITETACHAGHLDVVRELIDGRRWLVLTE